MAATSVGYGLAALIAAGIIAVGLRFLQSPRRAAAGFGVPAEKAGDHAYQAVKGIRDQRPGSQTGHVIDDAHRHDNGLTNCFNVVAGAENDCPVVTL